MIDETAVVHEGASMGSDCNVGPHSLVGNHVEVADSVQIGSRVMLNTAFASPSASIRIEEGVVIGDGSVVVGPLSIGAFSIVKPGSIVTRSIPKFAVVEGNPAQVVDYVRPSFFRGETVEPPHEVGAKITVAGCDIWRLPLIADLRGNLTHAELGQYLPFQPKRFFLVFDVPNEKIRGSHAHHELHELLICVKGSVIVTLDNGSESRQLLLNDPTVMLHLRPKTWTTQYSYSSDAVLMVLCSHPYEAEDYIRDYDTFLEVCREQS